MDKREDGFYWVKVDFGVDNDWQVANYTQNWPRPWSLCGTEEFYTDNYWLEIGELVQRDSEVVKQRDELLVALKEVVLGWQENEGVLLGDMDRLIARIEAESLVVKP